MPKNNCSELYIHYKNICKIDPVIEKCMLECNDKTCSNLSIEQIHKIIMNLLKKAETFKKCKDARKNHMKKCYKQNSDAGHIEQLRILNNSIKFCENYILSLKHVLLQKQKMIKESLKDLRKLK